MDPRPYVLAETNWKTVKEQDYKVAILPWGATEAHNYHLPYATDNFQAEYISQESAGKAWAKGAKSFVLPVIPFGVNTGQLDVDLCINMNPSTQLAILEDIVDVLTRQKIEKLVILNSHGGNNFKQIIRELAIKFPDVFVCSINWWMAVNPSDYFDEPGDHAGELETSAMMHIKPDWVLPLSEAGDGAEKKFKIKGLKQGWVTAQRKWTSVTKDTGVGNPALATKEKGEVFLNVVIDEVSDFLVELATADVNDMYE
jgi:creatinine amidohydrolase